MTNSSASDSRYWWRNVLRSNLLCGHFRLVLNGAIFKNSIAGLWCRIQTFSFVLFIYLFHFLMLIIRLFPFGVILCLLFRFIFCKLFYYLFYLVYHDSRNCTIFGASKRKITNTERKTIIINLIFKRFLLLIGGLGTPIFTEKGSTQQVLLYRQRTKQRRFSRYLLGTNHLSNKTINTVVRVNFANVY